MDEVGEGPDNGHADKGDAEKDDVKQADAQDVRQPDPPAVHHPRVRVHLAVRRAHVHVAGIIWYKNKQKCNCSQTKVMVSYKKK